MTITTLLDREMTHEDAVEIGIASGGILGSILLAVGGEGHLVGIYSTLCVIAIILHIGVFKGYFPKIRGN